MPRRLILPSLLILSTSVAFCTCRLEYHHGSGGGGDTTPIATIQVIGHRGTSTLRPEHTPVSYQKAIDNGADIIGPNLVSTKDGVLIARHENEISGTISVADMATFTGCETTRTVDGQSVTGWFTKNFTPGELETLRVRERISSIHPGNVAYNDQFDIPTLDEIIMLARDQSTKLGRNIGIYPETKHPTYFQLVGLPLEDRLIDGLCRDTSTASCTTVYIQSFEVANLKTIRSKIGGNQPNWKLVQLVGISGRQPYDFVVTKDSHTFGDMMTSQSIHDITACANGVGPDKNNIMGLDMNNKLTDLTDLVRNAHNTGLVVHPYTFRPENTFPPPSLRSGVDDARSVNGSITEIQAFLHTGVNGFLTDDPAVRQQAVSTFKR